MIIIIGYIALSSAVIAGAVLFAVAKTVHLKRRLKRLADNTAELSVTEFFKLRSYSFGGKKYGFYSTNHDFAGVYILVNTTKNLHYVGQGQRVLNRINNHFTGKGNGDVYADYKYGDSFTVKMITLKKSGFKSLNELERQTIKTYDSRRNGYNKTRGNK